MPIALAGRIYMHIRPKLKETEKDSKTSASKFALLQKKRDIIVHKIFVEYLDRRDTIIFHVIIFVSYKYINFKYDLRYHFYIFKRKSIY